MNRRSVLTLAAVAPSGTLLANSSVATPLLASIEGVEGLIAHLAVQAPRPDFWLFGETHGTLEMPSIFFSVVQAMSAVRERLIIGLEFPQSDEHVLNTLITNRDCLSFREVVSRLKTLPSWSLTAPRDGRTSVAMATMLWQLHDLACCRKTEVTILCIGGNDRVAADRLLNTWSGRTGSSVLTLTGSLHAIKAELPEPFRSRQGDSIGYLLKDRNAYSIQLVGLAGSAWFCNRSVENCGVQEMLPPLNVDPCPTPICVTTPVIRSGFDLRVTLQRITSSMPV